MNVCSGMLKRLCRFAPLLLLAHRRRRRRHVVIFCVRRDGTDFDPVVGDICRQGESVG